MNNSRKLLLILLCSGMILGRADGAWLNPTPAFASPSMPMETTHETKPETTDQFRQVEHPFGVKAAVTVGGFALIGLELWWFLFSKPNSKNRANPQ